jgi:hypothetical protein
MQTGQAEYDQEMFKRLVEATKHITPGNDDDHEQLLVKAVFILNPSLDLGNKEQNMAPLPLLIHLLT